LSKIKGGLSYEHVFLYPFLRSYSLPKGEVKINFLFFFSNFGEVKKLKFGGHFSLVQRILINIFLILPVPFFHLPLWRSVAPQGGV
jgi:hypothetical protein